MARWYGRSIRPPNLPQDDPCWRPADFRMAADAEDLAAIYREIAGVIDACP